MEKWRQNDIEIVHNIYNALNILVNRIEDEKVSSVLLIFLCLNY